MRSFCYIGTHAVCRDMGLTTIKPNNKRLPYMMPCIVMEACGQSLSDYRKQPTGISFFFRVVLMCSLICCFSEPLRGRAGVVYSIALSELVRRFHMHGYLHRDLKPVIKLQTTYTVWAYEERSGTCYLRMCCLGM